MNLNRRHALATLTFAVATAAASLALPAQARSHDEDGYRSGMVFVSSNAAAGNELLVYARGEFGDLSLAARLPTGGVGSVAGLGSQGAVTLSEDGDYLFVVNAQSNSVSTFAVTARELRLVSVVNSGGLHPISVAEHDGLVYVLNDGGAGNVAGFRNSRGQLSALAQADAVRPLSAAGGTAPAQVGFASYGDSLVVTEKGTNRLVSYRVRDNGSLGAPLVSVSPGATPFGFAVSRQNRLVVTEAQGAASGASTVSSYRFTEADPSRPLVASGAVPNTQSASCWVSIPPNGRYAFVANTGSSTMSSYRIARNGQVSLLAAVAGDTGAGSAPADTAISADGRHLYVRNGRVFTIAAFGINADGSLVSEHEGSGLPTTAVGLAAN